MMNYPGRTNAGLNWNDFKGDKMGFEERSEDEIRADLERQLARYDSAPSFASVIKRGIQVMRTGYTTAEMAILLGYLFILLPKLAVLGVSLLLFAQNRDNGRFSLAILIVGALVYNVWNSIMTRVWFRWASGAILPEEAKAFYSLDPKWLMGEDLWIKLTSSGDLSPSDEDQD